MFKFGSVQSLLSFKPVDALNKFSYMQYFIDYLPHKIKINFEIQKRIKTELVDNPSFTK